MARYRAKTVYDHAHEHVNDHGYVHRYGEEPHCNARKKDVTVNEAVDVDVRVVVGGF